MNITIEGRDIAVSLSKTACQALERRRSPLQVELELLFSCLVRKRVNFSEQAGEHAGVSVQKNLNLVFRPVMTRACGMDHEGPEPPLTDFPIENIQAVVPKWVKIDFRRGNWLGEFGY